ncbi:GNAT family N-acetyltransferase [Roseomonas sp. CCTCC AB2023176]|uniref:GNAT family N-acetyltransferase n=1 Tax=Roseomonas sp. CCTCC AB2023176 TaxID=3342640 RepID=UPI0035DB71D8
MQDIQVHPLRHLARGFVGAAGALDHAPLTEAGVLFELTAVDGVSRAGLSTTLGLGESRLQDVLERFASRGWLTGDALNGPVRLSAAGRAAGQRLQDDAHGRVTDLLGVLSHSVREGLADGARGLAQALADLAPAPAVIRRHRPGDLGWIAERHAALYAREYGLNGRFEAVVARICADFLAEHDPSCEAAFIAEQGGQRVASTVVVREDRETARLRLVLVEPEARGSGLGKRMVGTAETFARAAGYRRMVLWTLSPLTTARAIYAGTGWTIISSTPDSSYGPVVESEVWGKAL